MMLSADDKQQLAAKGISEAQIHSQLTAFEKGIPRIRLNRPCTRDDGINVLDKKELNRLASAFQEEAAKGRAMKFVPASGAATRMFKSLFGVYSKMKELSGEQISKKVEQGEPSFLELNKFLENIHRFAFYDDLKSMLDKQGFDFNNLIKEKQYKEILAALLEPDGLNYTNLPKGLIKFHRYKYRNRAPFEEQLAEAVAYVRDRDGICRIHFTISPQFQSEINSFFREIREHYENDNIRFKITFSVQKPSTDTIAVDLQNKPFREDGGELHFRPGGHGALLENLHELNGDIIFIKNIDNVIPDRLKHETFIYKRALGGYLVEIQNQIFDYLRKLATGNIDTTLMSQMFGFAKENLSIFAPAEIQQASKDAQIRFLYSQLNRPLRVCGMVKNEGEPGGGPFWIDPDPGLSCLQIVESAQVDMSSPDQRNIWESSTHFNPVDLVCGVRDFTGKPFNLPDFTDPNSGIISQKTLNGRDLKALEKPGLWNGGMAKWNTIFVEVPIITFNPVKTIFDLLRPEHQPEEIS